MSYIAYPFFVRVEKQTANKAHPVSKAFAGLDLFWPSPMEVSRSAEYPDDKLEALAFTSPSAWVQYPLQEGDSPYMTDPFSTEKPVKTAEGQYPAAAALQSIWAYRQARVLASDFDRPERACRICLTILEFK